MRKTVWMSVWGCAALIGFTSAPALAADGDSLTLNPDQLPWARWQSRLSLGTSTSSPPTWLSGQSAYGQQASKVSSASLMGDYYFGRSLVGPGNSGGFRATSGLIFGPRTSPLSSGQPTLAAGNAFSIGSRLFGQNTLPSSSDASAESATLPYLGFGYTGLSARNRWSFSADLGLVAQQPGGLKMIRSQSLDDVVREMRLAPLVQLGASYAF
jgi:hypothetical protein